MGQRGVFIAIKPRLRSGKKMGWSRRRQIPRGDKHITNKTIRYEYSLKQ